MKNIRGAEDHTLLRNLVNVTYDGRTETVYIAEAANGKILAFTNIGTDGNLTSNFTDVVATVSAIYLLKQK